MKTRFFQLRKQSATGAALIIVLAFVVLLTVLSLTYFSRTTTDRQLAQSSFNDTTADLLVRSALDITVSDLKQEIANNPTVTTVNIQPTRYPAGIPTDNPNLIRYSSRNAAPSRASTVRSTDASANGRSISLARWNSHYLIPRLNTGTEIDSTPVASFIAPDWVLVTAQGPNPAPAPNAVIGRYAFAVYDEGGLIDVNLGGFPFYARLTLPGLPTPPGRRLPAKYPLEESEIMLAACQTPNFTPENINRTGGTGTPFSVTPNTNHNPTSFAASFLPHGLSINTSTGTISGVPTSPGTFTITLTASNACGTGTGTLNLTIQGLPSPDSTPWPVNLARKGTVAFADLTALPSTPTAITPTTPVGSMENFLNSNQINKAMGWRNYATTQQPTSATFDSPSFPSPAPDFYAKNFLGAALPLTTSFTTVSTAVRNNRTDQAAMSRQELINLQRTIGFSQSLLQYLGTFSREQNRPAADWSGLSGGLAAARWDMNNLALAIPNSWVVHPGNSGQGHAYGLQRRTDFARLFGLLWVDGTWAEGTRLTDPNYYGRWKYFHTLDQLPAEPDFFQVINYALKQGNGGVSNPDQVFKIGAALIDQYDTDDLFDPAPGQPPGQPQHGNTITIIDKVGNANPADYVYGIEGMSFDDPTQNLDRPPFAPYPPPVPANYVLLNRRFENVGEFGYAYNPASTTPSKTLDFASATSPDKPLLDFFTYNSASKRAGIVNLNTRNGPVLASIIRGAWLHDLGSENLPPNATYLVSQTDALAAGQAIVQETTSTTAGRGPAVTRADVARLAAAAAAALPGVPGAPEDEKKQTIARALAEVGQARTWNLMIDVIAQTGKYTPGTPDLADPAKFIVQGEKRYWLHIALDRDDGNVLGTQLEEVVE
jgi:Putative Ig domain